MRKGFILLLFLASVESISGFAQDKSNNGPLKVVLLGDYQSCECDWVTSDSAFTFVKACVPDFSSQQLGWTVDQLVIKPLMVSDSVFTGLCILNTGQIDVSLGVPSSRVIENIDTISRKLASRNIGFVVMASLNFTVDSEYNRQLTNLNNGIKAWCDSTGTGYIDPNPILSPSGILSADYVRNGFLINATGCKHWTKIVNDFLFRYENEK